MVFDEERLPVTGTAAPVISDRRWVVDTLPSPQVRPPVKVEVLPESEEVLVEVLPVHGDIIEHPPGVSGRGPAGPENGLALEKGGGPGLAFTAVLRQAVSEDLVPHRIDDIVLCLLYTSDAADDLLCVDLGGR